jgi:hypothetical protein
LILPAANVQPAPVTALGLGVRLLFFSGKTSIAGVATVAIPDSAQYQTVRSLIQRTQGSQSRVAIQHLLDFSAGTKTQ